MQPASKATTAQPINIAGFALLHGITVPFLPFLTHTMNSLGREGELT